jgi:hypothetical protein
VPITDCAVLVSSLSDHRPPQRLHRTDSPSSLSTCGRRRGEVLTLILSMHAITFPALSLSHHNIRFALFYPHHANHSPPPATVRTRPCFTELHRLPTVVPNPSTSASSHPFVSSHWFPSISSAANGFTLTFTSGPPPKQPSLPGVPLHRLVPQLQLEL